MNAKKDKLIKKLLDLSEKDPKLSIRRIVVFMIIDSAPKKMLTNTQIHDQGKFASKTYTRMFLNDAIKSGYLKKGEGEPIYYSLSPKAKKAISLFDKGDKE